MPIFLVYPVDEKGWPINSLTIKTQLSRNREPVRPQINTQHTGAKKCLTRTMILAAMIFVLRSVFVIVMNFLSSFFFVNKINFANTILTVDDSLRFTLDIFMVV